MAAASRPEITKETTWGPVQKKKLQLGLVVLEISRVEMIRNDHFKGLNMGDYCVIVVSIITIIYHIILLITIMVLTLW